MLIKKVEVSDVLSTNAYFYIDEASRHGFLIDPGAQAQKLKTYIKENDWVIEKILITHAHFDHIGAVEELALNLGCDYFSHRLAEKYLSDPRLNLSAFCASPIRLEGARYFDDNEEITSSFFSCSLKVIHTPGHTPDGVIFYDKDNKTAFAGDLIFKNGIGATHYPGGNYQQLRQSIIKKVFRLPDDTILYPGHGESSTVGDEKQNFSVM
ncbi:MAG: MBL fold metallo-hydrolase [Alphaproteobacteria bacterium]|nr:MBL fold metallo-hydrolase [Alphaproteobacteria bacterium]